MMTAHWHTTTLECVLDTRSNRDVDFKSHRLEFGEIIVQYKLQYGVVKLTVCEFMLQCEWTNSLHVHVTTSQFS